MPLPQADFQSLKQRIPIDWVLAHYGVKLRPAGPHTLYGACPLPTHTSRQSRESFSVNLSRRVWSCHSASCIAAREGRIGGHVIDLARFAHVPGTGGTEEGYVVNVKPGDYYLSRLAVVEGARGEGIGSRLAADFEAEARAAGCTRLVLEVSADNERAVHFYETRGFTRLDVAGAADAATGRRLEYVHMAKPLA